MQLLLHSRGSLLLDMFVASRGDVLCYGSRHTNIITLIIAANVRHLLQRVMTYAHSIC